MSAPVRLQPLVLLALFSLFLATPAARPLSAATQDHPGVLRVNGDYSYQTRVGDWWVSHSLNPRAPSGIPIDGAMRQPFAFGVGSNVCRWPLRRLAAAAYARVSQSLYCVK
jgi:hypothetical protein